MPATQDAIREAAEEIEAKVSKQEQAQIEAIAADIEERHDSHHRTTIFLDRHRYAAVCILAVLTIVCGHWVHQETILFIGDICIHPVLSKAIEKLCEPKL